MHWTRLLPGGTAPSARYGHAAAYDPARDQMVISAGNWGDCSTDAYTLSLAPGGSWARLPDMILHNDERVNHGSIYDPVAQRVLVFGGECLAMNNDVQSVYLLSGPFWYRSAPAGTRPSPREGMSVVFDPVRRRMLVIGGYDGTYLGDVWDLTMSDHDGGWGKLVVAGTPMPNREGHTAVYDPGRDRIVVFGGNAGDALNDVWSLSLGETPTWTRITAAGTPPTPRWRHVAIYDPDHDRVVVFGGSGTSRFNDVWALSLGGTPTWEQLYSSTPGPSARYSHSAIWDAQRHTMVVFGGEVGPAAFANDVWTLEFDAPTATALSLVSAEAFADRVHLVWSAVNAPSLLATVYRQDDPSGEWTAHGAPTSDGDQLAFDDRDVTPGARYGYRLGVREDGSETFSSTAWVTVPITARLSLAIPSPGDGRLAVRFSLPDDRPASLAVFDLAGRLRSQRDVGGMGVGEHAMTLGETLPAGVYLIRLTHGDETLRSKATVLR